VTQYIEKMLGDRIAELEATIEKLKKEIDLLQHECYFGAVIAFMVGAALGTVIGVSITWL
jgi:hypothetical protein